MFYSRIDMTADKRYTISPIAKDVFSSLKDSVKITVYMSDTMPSGMDNLKRDTMDFIEELAGISNGSLEYVLINPNKELESVQVSKKTQDAVEPKQEFDKSGQPIQKVHPFIADLNMKGIFELQDVRYSLDKQEVVRYWSAIRMTYLDRPSELILPYKDVQSLEYELLTRVVRLMQNEKPVITVIDSPLKPQNGTAGSSAQLSKYGFLEKWPELVKLFDVKRITLTANELIPPKTKVLFVMEPKRLSHRQAFEINSYISSGGNTVIFTNGISMDLTGSSPINAQPVDSGLEDIFDSWGISFGDKFIASSKRASMMMPVRDGMYAPVPISTIPVFTGDALNRNIPLTRALPGVCMPWSTKIVFNDEVFGKLNLKRTDLVTSGHQSFEMEYEPIFRSLEPFMELVQEDEMSQPLPMIVMLEGKMPFAYEGRKLPSWILGEVPADDAPIANVELKNSKVVIVASPEMMSPMWFQQIKETQTSLLLTKRLAEAFALKFDLANLQTKSFDHRQITTDGISTAQIYAYYLLTIIGVPLLVIMHGLIRTTRRRMKRNKYLKKLNNTGGSAE